MTSIFLAPKSFSTTSNSVCASTGAAAAHRRAAAAAGRGRRGDRGRRDAPLLFEPLDQVGQVEHLHVAQVL